MTPPSTVTVPRMKASGLAGGAELEMSGKANERAKVLMNRDLLIGVGGNISDGEGKLLTQMQRKRAPVSGSPFHRSDYQAVASSASMSSP